MKTENELASVAKAHMLLLANLSRQLRREILDALSASGGGHYGGSLSCLDILIVIYDSIMRDRDDESERRSRSLRDRFILSKGHAAVALYAVLHHYGILSTPLNEYGRFGAGLEGHPDSTTAGIDFPTGSLGQGLSVGLGMAYALRSGSSRVWVLLGDGECQEGQVWETAMLASRMHMHHLHAIVDCNGHQEYGWPQEEPLPAARAKWEAFGWNVFTADGHNHSELQRTLQAMRKTADSPSVCLARTIKGYGFEAIVADPARFHCTTVTPDEHRQFIGGSNC